MAAAMAAQIFAEAGLMAEVLSAGVNAWANQPASRHAITAMKEAGLCLASHKSALVSPDLLEGATIVLTMTHNHRAALVSDYPGVKDCVFTLGEYIGECTDVADPFGGNLADYRACAAQIKAMLLGVVKRLEGGE